MKEETVRLTLAVDLGLREELLKRIVKFGRVKILERSSEAIKEIDEAHDFVAGIADRLGVRPELGYTEIIQGKTIRRFEFRGSSVKEILEDIKSKVLVRVEELSSKVSELDKASEQLLALKNEEAKYAPLKGISADLSFLQGLRSFSVKMYTSKEPAKLEGFLHAVVQRDEDYLIVAAAPKEKEAELEKLAYSLGLTEVQAPPGSPEQKLKELRAQEEALSERINKLSQEVEELKLKLEDEINAALEALSVLKEAAEMGKPVRRFLVTEVEVLKSDLKRFYSYFSDIAIIGGLSKAEEVELVNPPYVKNFDQLTETQGVPGPYEIDPTPIISFVFPFFFGFMFPDLGQGLIIALLGLIIYFKGWKNKKKWGAMLASFGVSATIMGALVGEVFGFDASQVPVVGGALERIAVLRGLATLSSSAIFTLLSVAILIGIFHLTSGFFIDFKQALSRSRAEALMEKLPVLIAYVGAVFIGLSIIGNGFSFNLFSGRAALIGVPNRILSSITVPLTAASIFFFLGYTAKKESPLDASIQFMFIIIEFLANTISYSRLAILFLVHIILMKTLNGAAAMGLVSLPLLVFGNLGIMALEGLIVYIQSLRLHIYEWFTKFYVGSGTRFRPLNDALLHAYINIS